MAVAVTAAAAAADMVATVSLAAAVATAADVAIAVSVNAARDVAMTVAVAVALDVKVAMAMNVAVAVDITVADDADSAVNVASSGQRLLWPTSPARAPALQKRPPPRLPLGSHGSHPTVVGGWPAVSEDVFLWMLP